MIRQFDVFKTPLRRDATARPYVIVVQANWIDSSARICAPLVAEKYLKPIGRLNPVFEIEGRRVYFHPVELAVLPVRILADPTTNLEHARDQLIPALDLVFSGI